MIQILSFIYFWQTKDILDETVQNKNCLMLLVFFKAFDNAVCDQVLLVKQLNIQELKGPTFDWLVNFFSSRFNVVLFIKVKSLLCK